MAKHYDEEFKLEAVRLVIERGRRVKQVAGELGLNAWTVRGWVRRYGKETYSSLATQGVKLSAEEENRLLRKELADVAEERDILKKAIAVFSKKSRINTLL